MKICFIPAINCDYWNVNRIDTRSYIPLGLLSLATILHENDYDVDLLDVNKLINNYDQQYDVIYENLALDIVSKEFNVLGFSTMALGYQHSIRLAEECKKIKKEIKVIFGGPQASVVAKETLTAYDFIDLIIKGEAEESILSLMTAIKNNLSYDDIPNAVFRRNNVVVENAQAKLCSFDELPMFNYELLKIKKEEIKSFPLDVGRGCGFHCTFCETSLFWKHSPRVKSAKRLIEEIKYLHDKYGTARFQLEHDMLLSHPNMVRELCEQLNDNKMKITWSCSARADCINYTQLQAMKQAGLRTIYFGVESGDSEVQKKIMKNLNLNKVEEVFKATHELGIDTIASFIVGFPYETLSSINYTFRFMLKLRCLYKAKITFSWLMPFKGSSLFEEYSNRIILDACYETNEIHQPQMLKQYPLLFSAFYHYSNLDFKNIKPHNFVRFVSYLIDVYPFIISCLLENKIITIIDLYEKSDLNYSTDMNWAMEKIDEWLESYFIISVGEDNSQWIQELMHYEKIIHDLSNGKGVPTEHSMQPQLLKRFTYNMIALIESIKAKEFPEGIEEGIFSLLYYPEKRQLQFIQSRKESS